jgi:hypothetical protein
MITLIAMFAVLAALFQGEIKETYTNFENYRTTDSCFDKYCPQSKTLAGPWGGAGMQMTRVGSTVIGRGLGKSAVPVPVRNYELGYDTNSYQVSEMYNGVDTTRNMQAKNPTRFMSTSSPKFASMNPDFRATAAVPLDRTEISAAGGCGMNTVSSGFGQMQHSNGANSESVVEHYSDFNEFKELPKDMCSANVMDADTQPVIYDRLIYSNIKSRLRGHGDYIRGDLMIVPNSMKTDCQNNGWFQVSVHPNRDLNMGAMSMIGPLGGRDEEIALGIAQGDCSVASFGI